MAEHGEEKRYFASRDYILREIAGERILVSVGQEIADFCGIVNLNQSAAVLWAALQRGASAQELVTELQKQFEVAEEQAEEDVEKTLQLLCQRGMIYEG